MKVVSFFSGAGGMDLGFAFAGHEIIWANDFDKYAVETYNYNIGKHSSHNAVCCDIVELLDTNNDNINKIIPNCDIIIGGFPCQGFSIANINRNMEDDRNFLYLQLLKAISVKKPPFFLLENVKGLENMENGKVLNIILDDLECAGTPYCKEFKGDCEGYTVSYNVINAYNYGVPQNRERVIILGVRKDLVKHSIHNFINNECNTRKNLHIPHTHCLKSNLVDSTSPSEKLNNMYEFWKKGIVFEDTDIKPIYGVTTIRDAISDLPHEFNSDNVLNHTGSKCKVKISNRVGNRATNWNKHSPTIMGRGSGTGGPLIPPHPEQHRRLSVREVARLQTFPDKFLFCGSNSAGYRQIGNAVPVLMAYNIAKIFNKE